MLTWQEERKKEAERDRCVHTLLGRARRFPSMDHATRAQRGHIERAAINTPVQVSLSLLLSLTRSRSFGHIRILINLTAKQGSAADVAMCAMLEISNNALLKELGWRLLLQVKFI